MQNISTHTDLATDDSLFETLFVPAFNLRSSNGSDVITQEMLYEPADVPLGSNMTDPLKNDVMTVPDSLSQLVDVSLASGPVLALADGPDVGTQWSSLSQDFIFGAHSTSEAHLTSPQDVFPPNEPRLQEGHPFEHLKPSQKISVLIDQPPRHFKRWQTRIRNRADGPSFSLDKVLSQIYRHLEKKCGIGADELTRWYFIGLLNGERPTTFIFYFGVRPT